MQEQEKAIDLRGAPVFVTGACGFIGSAVTRALEAQGAKIRILVHDHDVEKIHTSTYEKIHGDIRNPQLMREAMQGMRYVFHLAAIYRLWTAEKKELLDVNINGTQIVMEEALRAGVERVIYTSSASTIKQNSKQPNGESALLPEGEAITAYTHSKIKAEQLIRNLISIEGLPGIIVKPSTVIGPGDYRPTPTGQIIYNAVRGKIPAYVDTQLNVTHVDDVAAGHIAALQRGQVGEDYILGGENISLQRILIEIAMLMGRSGPKVKIKPELLLPLAQLNEGLSLLTGRTPFLTVAGLKLARQGLVYDVSRAYRELGLQTRTTEETIKDATEWFVGSYAQTSEIRVES